MLFTTVLKDSKVFLKLYKKGKFIACDYLVAYFLPNRMPVNRFGITAGKKIGNAVERNRAKRIIREAYRQSELKLPIGYDIVVVAREAISGKKSTELLGFFNRLSKEIAKNSK